MGASLDDEPVHASWLNQIENLLLREKVDKDDWETIATPFQKANPAGPRPPFRTYETVLSLNAAEAEAAALREQLKAASAEALLR